MSRGARYCAVLLGLIVAVIVAACLPGAHYDKVGSGAGGGVGGACQASYGACDQGVSIQLGGSADVIVTDLAQLGDLGHIVLVGRFSGSFSAGGPQLAATGNGTDGFLLELDGAGQYVTHLVLPEVDETSEVRVAVEPGSGELVVGGNYSDGPVGGCSSKRGLFVRRLRYAAGVYETTFDGLELVCVDAGPATEITVSDIGVYPYSAYIKLTGSFNGLLQGVTSSGVDGFVMGVNLIGETEPLFVVGGAGDAAIVGTIPSYDHNEWVLIGDFTGDLQVAVPNLPTQQRTALGTRDLFVVAYDTYEGNPNLSLTTLGAAGGDHRVSGVTYDPNATERAVMLAQLDGPIVIDNQQINAAAGSAALALVFQLPVDSDGTPFVMQDHYLLRADTLKAQRIAGGPELFFLAGEARGAIDVKRAGAAIGQVDAVSCHADAFVLALQGPTLSRRQRCGDGQQHLASASSRQPGAAIAFVVPLGASLDVGEGSVTVDSGVDSFVLLQP